MNDGNLKSGTLLKSEDGIEYKIINLLGSGGQGEVYKVQSQGNCYALKWYFPNPAIRFQIRNLRNLIIKEAPNIKFLWPKDIVINDTSFGYIMDLCPKGYGSIVDLMKRRVEPTLEILCLCGFNIARNFFDLHSKGFCYRDINFGNLFINFNDGDVFVCDNDNVCPNNENTGTIKGTMRFMAPEIVIGKSNPSINSDLFSLALLLFYLFNIHHPFEGKKESEIYNLNDVAMEKLYGKEPIFIWDPDNKSNRPIPGYQQNAIDFWKIYPNFFKEMFIKIFTAGVHNPQLRSAELEWQNMCIRLIDSIIYCTNQKCHAQNFFDLQKFDNQTNHFCWKCQKMIELPTMMKLPNRIIAINKNTKLNYHHTKNNYDIQTTIGIVNQNPNNPNQWGIKNISNEIWTYIKPNGENIFIKKGISFPLIKGSKINFGKNVGEIT